MEDKILALLEELTDARELREDPEIDLLDSGILDSLALLELIVALEDRFGVEVQPTQVPGDTWRSVRRIAALVVDLQEKTVSG